MSKTRRRVHPATQLWLNRLALGTTGVTCSEFDQRFQHRARVGKLATGACEPSLNSPRGYDTWTEYLSPAGKRWAKRATNRGLRRRARQEILSCEAED